MKTLALFIGLLLCTSPIFAQLETNNSIEFKVGYGGADGVPPGLISMQFAYARHIGFGLLLKPSFMITQGGHEPFLGGVSQEEFLSQYARFQDGDQFPNANFDQFKSFGMGLQKAINTHKKGSLNVMLGLRYTLYDQASISSVNRDPADREMISINPQYKKEAIFSYEVEISYYHQINDYLSAFVSGSALTKLFFFSGNAGLAVRF
jgi:hypothetical protein